jgi:uncharacterized membrane protein YkvA (DUF1232 family)
MTRHPLYSAQNAYSVAKGRKMRTASSAYQSKEADTLGRIERARLTWRLVRDPRVPVWMKAALPTIAGIYLIVPIDLIPDFILVFGQIDDLSMIGILLFAATKILPRIAPAELVTEHLSDLRRGKSGRNGRRNTFFDAEFTVVDNQSANQTGTPGTREDANQGSKR